MERGLNIRLCPVEDLCEFVPVIHFFEGHLLHRRTRDDQPIEFFMANIVEREIMIEQMFRVGIF
jgi:hypothetical protein